MSDFETHPVGTAARIAALEAVVKAGDGLAAAVDAMREAAIDAIQAIWSDVVEDMAEFGLEHPAQAEIDAIRALPTPPALSASPDVQALVDAAQGVERWDTARGYPIPYRVRDPLRAALAPFTGAKP
jgi:hypothetical protein